MRHFLLVLSIAGQLGYLIALPATFFAFGGAALDKKLGTSPLFVLLGIAVALTSSSFLVARLLRQINKES